MEVARGANPNLQNKHFIIKLARFIQYIISQFSTYFIINTFDSNLWYRILLG